MLELNDRNIGVRKGIDQRDQVMMNARLSMSAPTQVGLTTSLTSAARSGSPGAGWSMSNRLQNP